MVLGGFRPQVIPIGMSGPVMAPGHNHAPPGFSGGNSPPSPYLVPSRTPSPVSSHPSSTLLPTGVPTFVAPTYPHSGFYDAQLLQLFSQWPMNGPAVPDAMLKHAFHGGPPPDLVSMQQQLAQAQAYVAAGKHILENPEPADFANVTPVSKTYYTPAIDLASIPLIKADPRIHGQPLPAPPMLPQLPPVAPGFTSTWPGALSPM